MRGRSEWTRFRYNSRIRAVNYGIPESLVHKMSAMESTTIREADRGYTDHLIDLGRHDAAAYAEELIAFLS
jgi:hypothetical protein